MDLDPIIQQSLRGIVHDLNGQVFVIRGHAELGLNHASELHETERHFASIMERCDEVISVIHRLREIEEGGDDCKDSERAS